jgi:hypothetical protein
MPFRSTIEPCFSSENGLSLTAALPRAFRAAPCASYRELMDLPVMPPVLPMLAKSVKGSPIPRSTAA